MKLLIINNLSSGYREGAIYDFVRHFMQDADEICMRSTDGTTDIKPMLYDAREYDAVVASGGDGTISAVSCALAGTGIPILPFPAGTGNLLCLNLLSPTEPHALANLVREGLTLDFDICEMRTGTSRLSFNIMAGTGYDAVIMRDAEANKRLLGPIAYFASALANTKTQLAHFTIDYDGHTIERDGLCVLLVNFTRIQFDVPLAHDSDPRDGYMEVMIMKTENALNMIPALISAIRDRSGEFPSRTETVEVFRAKQVTISADPPLNIQYDGDPIEETTPMSVSVIPRAVRYIVSEEAYKLFDRA